jgi:hypothetical protein
MALHAFLALYDATNDASWLTDAQQAADYTESWLVAWGYGIDTPRAAYATDGPLGLSLIGAGGSGVDNWITYEGANFYRLYLYTGDAHYLTVASHLTSTAYRTTQYTGHNLGYGRDGLVEEATTLADLTYTGVGTWLPWSTVAQLEPLARLEDIFGSMDLATIEQLPLAERQRRNNAAGSTFVTSYYVAPASPPGPTRMVARPRAAADGRHPHAEHGVDAGAEPDESFLGALRVWPIAANEQDPATTAEHAASSTQVKEWRMPRRCRDRSTWLDNPVLYHRRRHQPVEPPPPPLPPPPE